MTNRAAPDEQRAGDDLIGILDTIDVPIVVVGRDCTLVRFNAAAAETLRLAASDVGRTMNTIAALADAADLTALCTQVVADAASLRRDFRIGDRRFLLRIAPYVRADGQPGGAVLTFTNVTAFRASLEQAVYEREYTKAILNTVSHPLLVVDAELRVRSANRAFYSMFGVSREAAEGALLRDLGGDDWKRGRLWASLAAVFSESRDFELVEVERDFPARGVRTIVLDARRISPKDGTAILIAVQDITERKHAEAVMQDNERRFREMVNALPVAVYTTDAEGRVTHFNPAAAEFAGRTPELGEDHWCVTWKLYWPDGTPMPHDEAPMAVALREARPVRGAQAIAERPDGERRWFEPYPTPLFDASGRLAGGINMLLDITERKKAEESLLQHTAQFETLLNRAPLGVYLVDGGFRIREVNPAALPMFANIPDVIGRDFDDVIHILWPKAYADEIVAHFRHTLETREPYVASERVEERLDTGHTEYYEWRIECIPLPDGDGVVCYFRDISEQVLARQSIQDSDRRKDEFLALLAHELRNPLAPIRTGLELIRLSGDTPQSVARVRSMMERQVNQMVRLIDDLLDVSRIASGKIVLQRTPTALTELVQSAIEAHRIVIESAKIALVVDLPDDSCVVDVDPTRFVQVLSNVLHNASKFTPAGGTIRCSAATRARGGGSEAVITVSDTGIGISRAMLPRIFDLFTQAEQPTKRAHGGLGIGLALARRLIGMHDGTITGHSDGLDQGTTFVITLPVFQGIASQATPRLAVPRLASRVVIVDDNRDAAIAMSMLIDQLGGSTRIAHDAEGGLAAIEAFEPDIVFLDIGMPGVDGYEACRRIRQHPSLRHLVVVAVTGWGQAQDKQRALDAGFDAHLTKPVDPTALADVLASLPRR